MVSTGRVAIPSATGGGIEEYIFNLSKEIASLGHDICVLDSSRHGRSKEIGGTRINRIPSPSLPRLSLFRKLRHLGNLCDIAGDYLWGRAVSRSELFLVKNDVVHLNLPISSIPLLRNAQGKKVYTVHTYLPSSLAGSLSAYASLVHPVLERLVARGVDATIATTRFVAAEIKRIAPDVGRKVHVVPLGVDTSVYRPMSYQELEYAKARYGDIIDDEFTITYVGRLAPNKGVETLLRAADFLRRLGVSKFKLILMGPLSGSFEREDASGYYLSLVETVRRLHLQDLVHFLGSVSLDTKIEFLNLSSLFVLPSEWENFGMAALEAMACGCPVLGSKVGGLQEIIEDGRNGFSFAPRDHQTLARFLYSIWQDRDLRKKLSSGAREIATTRYSWKEVAKRTCDVYEAVLHQKSW